MASIKLKEITDRILLKRNMVKGRSISLVDNVPVILAQVVRHKEFCESRKPIRDCDIEDISNTYREVWEYSNNYILSNYSFN
ncbi:hypothetical protein CBP51_03080 [Cellvibrio mixtus]|uniref:Uncharacterized protein n=1 Tax=Cellvibrio mixtus TaxID=39650 RepID=A0A266Q851_9GAMM|nr:hypothetical protein CBP51_03080 [Cellvibrio mixtus]